MAGGTLTPMLT